MRLPWIWWLCWLALAVPAGAAPGERRVLPGHVPAAVAGLSQEDPVAETNRLHLSLGLPLREPAALAQFLRELYDPASPQFRRYVTPEEFTARFGPREADYEAVVAFARAHGLNLHRRHPNRMILEVEATPAAIREAFQVDLHYYQHPREARRFFAPDRAPSVDAGLPLLAISGLDSYALPRPRVQAAAENRPGAAQPNAGSGPGGKFMGNDFRAAYAPGVTLTGAGQSVGLVEFDLCYTNDILNYQALAGISPPVPVISVVVDKGLTKPAGGDLEVSVDIEAAIAMAPGLASVLVYEAPYTYTSANDLLNRIATDNLAAQVSCSWSFDINPTTDQILQQMAAQGQTFFNATGDFGAYGANMEPKEGHPLITQVGGAVLTTTVAGGPWTSEQAWSGSAGGICTNYPIPYWQQGVSMALNQGSTQYRNLPDVALTSALVLVVYYNGLTNGASGTSISAPLWAGFLALANQQAAQYGRPRIGFLNPALYGIGLGSQYAACFHDLTSGRNTNAISPNRYFAARGYDLVSGWGTPTGQALINALAPPTGLTMAPASGVALGLYRYGALPNNWGGLLLSNATSSNLVWACGNPPTWLALSVTNGSLAPGGATNLAFGATAAAANLTVGALVTNLWLTNLTTSTVESLPLFLKIQDPLILVGASNGLTAGGPVGGPFTTAGLGVSLSNAATVPLAWTAAGSTWFQVAPTAGTLAPAQATNLMITVNPGATNLLLGTISGTLLFGDQLTGAASTLPCSLAVGNGDFETGDFTGWTFVGATNASYVGATPSYLDYVHGGYFAAIMGAPTNLATLSQTLPTAPGSNYLLSFWLSNPLSAISNQLAVKWNGATVYYQTNYPKIAWTNLEFILPATQSPTVLQFAFENTADAFGLDDVSLTLIPPLSLSPAPATNGALQFTWNTIPGLGYQLQTSTNLTAGQWSATGLPLGPTNSGLVTVRDTNALGRQRFYRLVQQLPH